MTIETRTDPTIQPPLDNVEALSSPTDNKTHPLAWLTVETALYAAIFGLGMGLRLWQLGHYPLSDPEAQQSLLALSLLRGEGAETANHYSPLFVSLQSLFFLLFGTSDALARLPSALLGGGLILLPFTLRRHLGHRVCLMTAALLAFTPSSLYLSRTINGEIAVAVGALGLTSGFLNWSHSGRQRWFLLGVASLAVILTAGPMAYTLIVVFAIIIFIGRTHLKTGWANGLKHAAAPQGVVLTDEAGAALRDAATATEIYTIPNPALTGADEAADDTPITMTDSNVSQLRLAALFFIALLTVLSTTALLNLSGFSIMTASLGEWFSRFGVAPRNDAGFNAVFSLTIYEPLPVFGGLAGLTLVIMRGKFPATIFAGWFVFALLLDIPMGGRPSSSLILILVPLAFLTAFALAELWQNVEQHGVWGNEGILLVAGLTIAGFAYIGLTGWLVRTCAPEETACQLAWLQAIAGLALFIVIIIFFALISQVAVALRGAALVGVALGLLALVNIGWRLNYGPITHQMYQPLAGNTPSIELVNLVETVEIQSIRRVGDPKLIDITLAGVNSPALRWQLRDYSNLGEGNPRPTSLVITPTDTELAIESAYIGQDFALDNFWSPVGLAPKQLIEWLLYRSFSRPMSPFESKRAVLWLQLENQE